MHTCAFVGSAGKVPAVAGSCMLRSAASATDADDCRPPSGASTSVTSSALRPVGASGVGLHPCGSQGDRHFCALLRQPDASALSCGLHHRYCCGNTARILLIDSPTIYLDLKVYKYTVRDRALYRCLPPFPFTTPLSGGLAELSEASAAMPLPLNSMGSEALDTSTAAGAPVTPTSEGSEARGSVEAAASAGAECCVVARTIGAKAVGCGRLKAANDGSDLET